MQLLKVNKMSNRSKLKQTVGNLTGIEQCQNDICVLFLYIFFQILNKKIYVFILGLFFKFF